jgi:hypothetical protein
MVRFDPSLLRFEALMVLLNTIDDAFRSIRGPF